MAGLLATASTAAKAQGDYEPGSYHHDVRAGGRIQIANARSWGPAPDCLSIGGKVVLTLRPQHGILSSDKVTTTVPEDRDECGGHPVATVRVFYAPSRTYTGPEHIAYDEVYANGRNRHVDEYLNVTP